MATPDAHALVRDGDAMLATADYGAAARRYAEVARAFDAGGEHLKTVAVFRQVRELIAKHALGERALDAEARARLPALYRALGLVEEALAVEREGLTD